MATPTVTRPATADVETVFGSATVTPGVIDDAALQAYTQGQCVALAAALHARTGWQPVVLLDYGNGWMSIDDDIAVRYAADRGHTVPGHYLHHLWSHALVRRPDGMLVDVNPSFGRGRCQNCGMPLPGPEHDWAEADCREPATLKLMLS